MAMQPPVASQSLQGHPQALPLKAGPGDQARPGQPFSDLECTETPALGSGKAASEPRHFEHVPRGCAEASRRQEPGGQGPSQGKEHP